MIDCSKTGNYFAEKQRMTKRTKSGICGIKCDKCPLGSGNNSTSGYISCISFEMYYPEKAIKIVQKWSNEHPPKTYLTDFLKHYPNVQLRKDGTPVGLCPHQLGLNKIADCGRIDNACVKCWNWLIPEDGEK